MLGAIGEMRAREGDAYDRWLAGLTEAAVTRAIERGLLPALDGPNESE